MNKEISKPEIKDILVIADNLPADFFTNSEYDKRLDAAIDATTGLVYTLDDDGEKMAKADATAINKFATTYDKFIAAVYKSQTEEIGNWRTAKKQKTKKLLDNRQSLLDQFAEQRNRKLKDIEKIVISALETEWIRHGIKKEFQNGNVDSLISLTGTLTPKGALTKNAADYIASIVAVNLTEQRRTETRHMTIENRCLREDINPPLTYAHMGESFTADDETFNAKLDFLILAEKERKKEMEERIKRHQAAENQRKIDDALIAQQAESDRIAREKMQEEQRVIESKRREEAAKLEENKPVIEEKPAGITRTGTGKFIPPASTIAPSDQPKNKKTVVITATFTFNDVDHSVPNDKIISFFERQLTEKLKAAVKINDVNSL